MPDSTVKKDSLPWLNSTMGSHRWQHLSLALAVRYLDSEHPRRIPRMIQIEATSKCNLRCPSCSHSREKNSGQHLTGEGLRRIIDWLPSPPARVRLSGIGEPLVNPHFFSLVDILSEGGIKCDFITNGTLLTPRIREAILSRHSIEGLVISCDGATESTFESCRLGAHFASWKQMVGDFLAEAKQQRGGTLGISMSTVINRQNLSEIPDIIRFAADSGFDGITLLEPIPLDDVAASLCPSQTEMSANHKEELLDMATALGLKASGLARRLPTPLARLLRYMRLGRCMQPWEYVFVRVSGAVAPCCALFGSDKAAFMGNAFQQDFADIWHGERFREFRRTSASGTNSLCRVCPYY